jgi:Lar family restriction alleviation protein
MADKLSPCPFCGGKPEFRRSGRQGHYIACTGCDASSNMFTALKDDVRELLTETWNRRSALSTPPQPEAQGDPDRGFMPKFALRDRVSKKSGSSWNGHVVGFYSTELTPIGYCVESEREPGSVQIYPEAALTGGADD